MVLPELPPASGEASVFLEQKFKRTRVCFNPELSRENDARRLVVVKHSHNTRLKHRRVKEKIRAGDVNSLIWTCRCWFNEGSRQQNISRGSTQQINNHQ